jgi:hypothetical protein
MVVDWSQVTSNRPAPKAVLNMRVDRDVLEFFRAEGRGYQTKINAVLRAYKDAARELARDGDRLRLSGALEEPSGGVRRGQGVGSGPQSDA